MAKKNEFSYSYRDDNDSTGANKLLKRAVLLFIISAILVAISHFFLIKKKEAFLTKEVGQDGQGKRIFGVKSSYFKRK